MARSQSSMFGALVATVAVIWAYPWLEGHRANSGWSGYAETVAVVSGADSGPGTLRDALFRALRSGEPSRVVIRVPNVALTAALPPLAGASGLVISTELEKATIDASAVRELPVVDVRSGRIRIENIEIRSSRGAAVRASGEADVVLDSVSVLSSDVGVSASGGASVIVEDSEFSGNRLGLEILGGASARVSGSRFTNQSEAGIWAVAAGDSPTITPRVTVDSSVFSGGRYGFVLANAEASLRENEISAFSDDGVLALGGQLTMAGNRVHGGGGAAIRSIGLSNVRLLSNQLHENSSLGILLQQARIALVDGNNLYRNGYGIVSVLSQIPAGVEMTGNLVIANDADGLVALGDAPAMTGNTAIENRSAGIRAYHLSTPSGRQVAAPLLVDNDLRANGLGGVIYSDYPAGSSNE